MASQQLRTKELAVSAFSLMTDFGVPPDPRAYEIFYTYAAGGNELLKRAVDSAAAAPDGLTPRALSDIHRAHFTPVAAVAEITHAGEEMTATIRQFQVAVTAGVNESGVHGDDLRRAQAQLDEDGDDPVVLKRMLATTAKIAEDMLGSITKLQNEAAEFQEKIGVLNTTIDEISKESLQDALTGVYNRKYFDLTLSRMLAEKPDGMALIMCDIDHFKNFNDTHGHQVGDQVLRLVSSCLASNVRSADVVARYGGEEFAVVLTGVDHVQAVSIAEKLRSAVASKQLIQRSTSKTLGQVTMSFGVANALPADTQQTLVERADKLLYAAKRAGRNRVEGEDTAPKTALAPKDASASDREEDHAPAPAI